MGELSKEWFELRDHRRRHFSRAGWIPIYGTILPIVRGEYPEIGHVEETLAVGSAVVFNEKREQAEEFGWNYWSQDDTIPYLNGDGKYLEAGTFPDDSECSVGFRLVLSQYLNSLQLRQIFINQDFVMAYSLFKEGDVWLRPKDGYEQVIRQTRNDEGTKVFVEVRAEYLKDYLAARKAALRLYCYRQRRAILEADPKFDWPGDFSLVSEKNDTCKVKCREIDSSGDFPGMTWKVLRISRTDVDPEEEIPDFSGNDDEATATESTSWAHGDGKGRFLVSGEMWRGEWIEPAPSSCRIGYSEPKETLMVQVDGGGGRVDLETLNVEDVGKYLWFKTEVVNALLSHRGASLRWYTCDTGGVAPDPSTVVHFGVNKSGLVNAYAYDVARKRLWERRIWVAHNSRPDGGVSPELLKAQMESKPANSKSPEFLIQDALSSLDDVYKRKFGFPVFHDHHEVEELEERIHRFRGVDENGLRSLAKDVVKISIERIDKGSLVKALGEEKSDQRTLKLLERLLSKYTEDSYAYDRMTPLFGVYDLRNAHAHLSSSDVEDCYRRIGVDRTVPPVQQAAQLLYRVAEAFGITGGDLNKYVPDQKITPDA